MKRIAILLLLLTLPAAADEPADPTSALYGDIVRGGVGAAFGHIREMQREAGIEVSSGLAIEGQSAFACLSCYRDDTSILWSKFLQEGEVLAYRRNCQREMTRGAWDPARAFGSEETARLGGNFTLAGILTHEIGHHIAEVRGLNPTGRAACELLADELAIRLMRPWWKDPELAALRDA